MCCMFVLYCLSFDKAGVELNLRKYNFLTKKNDYLERDIQTRKLELADHTTARFAPQNCTKLNNCTWCSPSLWRSSYIASYTCDSWKFSPYNLTISDDWLRIKRRIIAYIIGIVHSSYYTNVEARLSNL